MFSSLNRISLFDVAESDIDARGHRAQTFQCVCNDPRLGPMFSNSKSDITTSAVQSLNLVDPAHRLAVVLCHVI